MKGSAKIALVAVLSVLLGLGFGFFFGFRHPSSEPDRLPITWKDGYPVYKLPESVSDLIALPKGDYAMIEGKDPNDMIEGEDLNDLRSKAGFWFGRSKRLNDLFYLFPDEAEKDPVLFSALLFSRLNPGFPDPENIKYLQLKYKPDRTSLISERMEIEQKMIATYLDWIAAMKWLSMQSEFFLQDAPDDTRTFVRRFFNPMNAETISYKGKDYPNLLLLFEEAWEQDALLKRELDRIDSEFQRFAEGD
ncbi:MAG TPA: hypothetical protein GX505_14455 [Clostridiales bacterium]|nr:hypothetical protein [Clostridiales bacterium]